MFLLSLSIYNTGLAKKYNVLLIELDKKFVLDFELGFADWFLKAVTLGLCKRQTINLRLCIVDSYDMTDT